MDRLVYRMPENIITFIDDLKNWDTVTIDKDDFLNSFSNYISTYIDAYHNEEVEESYLVIDEIIQSIDTWLMNDVFGNIDIYHHYDRDGVDIDVLTHDIVKIIEDIHFVLKDTDKEVSTIKCGGNLMYITLKEIT